MNPPPCGGQVQKAPFVEALCYPQIWALRRKEAVNRYCVTWCLMVKYSKAERRESQTFSAFTSRSCCVCGAIFIFLKRLYRTRVVADHAANTDVKISQSSARSVPPVESSACKLDLVLVSFISPKRYTTYPFVRTIQNGIPKLGLLVVREFGCRAQRRFGVPHFCRTL